MCSMHFLPRKTFANIFRLSPIPMLLHNMDIYIFYIGFLAFIRQQIRKEERRRTTGSKGVEIEPLNVFLCLTVEREVIVK